MKKPFYKNNAPVVYLLVLHRLAGKCTKIYNACKTIARLLNPLVLRLFHCHCGLCKISAFVVYEKSRCQLISVLFASVFVILTEKLLKNSKRTIIVFHTGKRLHHTICPWKFPEIRPGIFGRMVSAHGLERAYRKAVFLARSSDNKSAR